jgi:hypothetical protein
MMHVTCGWRTVDGSKGGSELEDTHRHRAFGTVFGFDLRGTR